MRFPCVVAMIVTISKKRANVAGIRICTYTTTLQTQRLRHTPCSDQYWLRISVSIAGPVLLAGKFESLQGK